jgi:GNAT superfamily N-acetyltransferase
MKKDDELALLVTEKLSPEQELAVAELQRLAFTDVEDDEAEEDFYHPESAQVLAYVGHQLVGWAGIHETAQEYEGKKIRLGGYGICTHPHWQRKGIGRRVSRKAMDFLEDKGCEVAFLSVNLADEGSIRLHQKNGFVMLPQPFSWTNALGENEQDMGGMIAPVNSRELFEHVLNGKDALYVGNGYW